MGLGIYDKDGQELMPDKNLNDKNWSLVNTEGAEIVLSGFDNCDQEKLFYKNAWLATKHREMQLIKQIDYIKQKTNERIK